jgi:hypothetical protein
LVEFNRRIDQWRDQTRLAIQEVSAGNRRAVEEIQTDLVSSYRAHGIEPESDLSGLASFLRAVSGPDPHSQRTPPVVTVTAVTTGQLQGPSQNG